ncbi:MAG TPA: Uma2 family endonuclease [Gemmatimonadales bacterium]|nr:Uma2 family endonuclease [Gemmatimonadales bacterium]
MPHAAERWTAERVRALPDDGKRYELVSGQLVVTPSPRYAHQAAIGELAAILRSAIMSDPGEGPARLFLLHSPADISLGEDELLQPDLFVHRTATGRRAERWSDITDLVLVIEVVSPATARYDRHLKRLRYQRAGIPEYWIVDLDARLIERWRPGDERPEILAERIAWRAEGSAGGVEIDLPGFFGEVLGVDG